MNEIINADYMIVQERTLSVIVSEILTIEKNVCSIAMDGAVQIGQRLQEAKEQVDHGEWEDWCKNNLNYSRRQAERFMQIADKYGDENSTYSKATTSSHFSISKALELLKVPEDEVEKFVEEHPVEDMTVKELEAEIKQLKEEKKDAYDAAAQAEQRFSKLEAGKLEAEDKANAYALEIEEYKKKLENVKKDSGNPEQLKEIEERLKAAEAEAEAQKEKAKKLKDKAKEEKDKKEKEIEIAVEAARKEAKEQAMMESGVPELEEKIAALERKLQNSADETKMKFKLYVDELQEAWKKCLDCINSADAELADKMDAALNKVVDSWR